MTIVVRAACPADDAELARIDAATWTTETSPAPPPPPDAPFFEDGTDVADVLVAEVGGTVAGYVTLGGPTIPAHGHVVQVRGLAVDPALARRGIGRALVGAAVAESRRRGARKLGLRVLASNTAARRLYEAAGFVVEGVLRAEFRLDGRFVDDVLMARHL